MATTGGGKGEYITWETENFVQLSEKSDTHSILIHMHFVSIYVSLFMSI